MGVLLKLLPGIKRKVTRQQDARAAIADQGLKAKRPAVLSRDNMTCRACQYKANDPKHLDVHHIDDDHQNNADVNLAALCHTCHPYQHTGEIAARTDIWSEGLGKKTVLARIPEVSARDLNLLLRTIGAALQDPASADVAREIYSELLERCDPVEAIYGSYKATDFAAAMAALSPEQYANRESIMADERLIFSEKVLGVIGKEFIADHPSLPVAAWEQAVSGLPTTTSPGAR